MALLSLGTAIHPVWCVNADAWVALGELVPGDCVQSHAGPLGVAKVERLTAAEPVYNIEVDGEHVYEVTARGILVHNNGFNYAPLAKLLDLKAAGKWSETLEAELAALRNAAPEAYKSLTTAEEVRKLAAAEKAALEAAELAKAGSVAPKGFLTGSLDGLTKSERKFAEELLDAGKNVEIMPRGAGRTPDFKIDGVLHELKTLSGVANQTSDGISKAIANRVMNGRGQAGHIIVDARGQAGITKEIAERGIGRAYGADNKLGGKIQSIRVIGNGFDITIPRKP